jgi:ribosomal protein L37E
MRHAYSAADAAARLAQQVKAWLPTDDAEAHRSIVDLMAMVARTGVDPFAALRDAMSRCFGEAAKDLLSRPVPTDPAVPAMPGTVALEPLAPLRRATLWPQRPKRFPDELFSSWLWRAAIAAGAAPSRFAADALGAGLLDPDREVGEAMLCRLALASGQAAAYLANGALTPPPRPAPLTRAEVVQDALLRHGRPLLIREVRTHPPRGVLQYCPRCLAKDPQPYFRRGWRFAVEAVCVRHACRLHDACWRCGAVVALLAQSFASRQPVCATCGAVLARGAVVPAPKAARGQRGLACVLYYAAVCLEPDALKPHLAALDRQFAPASRISEREAALARLSPDTLDEWFGLPAEPRQRDLLAFHAGGGAYGAWFGSGAPRPAPRQSDLSPSGKIRPLSRRRIRPGPWFAAAVARPRRAIAPEAAGTRRPISG